MSVSKRFNIIDSFKRFAKENRSDIYRYLLFSLSFPITDVSIPTYYGKITKSALQSDFDSIYHNIKILAILWITSQGLHSLLDRLDSSFIPKLKSFVREEIVSVYLSRLSRNYIEPNTGTIMHQIVKLPSMVVGIFNVLKTYYLPGALIVVLGTSTVLYQSRELGMILLGYLFIAGMFLRSFVYNLISKVGNVDNLQAEMHEDISDVFSNLLSIFAIDATDRELDRFREFQERYDVSIRDAIRDVSTIKRYFYGIFTFMFLTIILQGTRMYSRGEIDVDVFMSVMFITEYMISWLNSIVDQMKNLVFDIGMVLSINENIESIPNSDTSDDITLKVVSDKDRVHDTSDTSKKSIYEIRDLSSTFVYTDINGNIATKTLIYPDIDIYKGDFVVISGINGKGKSNLLYMMMGLRPFKGSILYKGRSVYSCKDVYRSVSFIQQSIKLFNRSIWDNIFYGIDIESGVSDSISIEQEKLKILDMMQRYNIEMGDLDRLAGRDGCNVSGGQRQFISLFRILVQNRDVLIIDEPTNNLDKEKIDILIEILKTISKRVTIIVTTHDNRLVSIAGKVIHI